MQRSLTWTGAALALLAVACAKGASNVDDIVEDDGSNTGGGGGQGLAGPGPGAGPSGPGPGAGGGGSSGVASGGQGGTPGTGGMGGAGGTSNGGAGGGGGGCTNLLTDGNFELGPGGGFWTEYSTNFPSPICDTVTCNPGPHGGTNWFWGGGTPDPELSWVSRTVTIPVGTATITFWLRILSCDPIPGDTFDVFMDGVSVYATDNTDALCGAASYHQLTVPINAYANGGAHTVRIESVTVPIVQITNFLVDDVVLEACP